MHTVFRGQYFHAVAFEQTCRYLTYRHRVIDNQYLRQTTLLLVTRFSRFIIKRFSLLILKAGIGTDHGWQIENDNNTTIPQNRAT